jgi:hypothetical protein
MNELCVLQDDVPPFADEQVGWGGWLGQLPAGPATSASDWRLASHGERGSTTVAGTGACHLSNPVAAPLQLCPQHSSRCSYSCDLTCSLPLRSVFTLAASPLPSFVTGVWPD